jgi:hypothetical protein
MLQRDFTPLKSISNSQNSCLIIPGEGGSSLRMATFFWGEGSSRKLNTTQNLLQLSQIGLVTAQLRRIAEMAYGYCA